MKTKKNSKADLEKKRPLFMQIGLVTALAVSLIAFEWTTYETSNYELGELTVDMEEEEMIPITQREITPPPPKPVVPEKMVIVPDEKEIDDPVIQPTDFTDEPIVFTAPDEKEEEELEIFTIVEQMPSFIGGDSKLFEFLGKNIKYPAMAKDAGIKGTVYVNFVVNENGEIEDAKLIRGIGGGCDEEALRVVKKMPNWTPGKQRGKKVKVSYNLPIKFTLK